MEGLRSAEWFAGDDEVALLHRVAMRSAGLEVSAKANRPVIGIADSASDLNPCNLPLRALAEAVREGVLEAGGIPARFPTMSLGEDLMKPSAFLYRNLLSMEIEETLRSNPLDGAVLLANCDKTVPAVLMGAASADLPSIVVLGGARAPAMFGGRRLGTGTDLWRLWDDHRTGRLNDQEWAEVERCLSCSLGACNTMGTASTMAILTETLGMALPGSSTIPAGDPASLEAARAAGRRSVELVRLQLLPSQIMTSSAFDNAWRVLHAIGGSTNAIIHLSAIAGRLAIRSGLDELVANGRGVPLLADVEPSGTALIQDFHAAGAVPALLRELVDLLDTRTSTVVGRLSDILAAVPERTTDSAIRTRANPLRTNGSFAVVRGTLAPDGAVIKTSAASPELFRHRGPAVVFRDYHDMRSRIDDPDLEVTPESVLVLASCGPVGVPGMPEWGMIPIPAKLVAAGVRDMVRVTDARMSGTSFGTVLLHASPEAAVGGPLALVRDGDIIVLDVEAGLLDLDVTTDELELRRTTWIPPKSMHLRGWPALYQRCVTQAPEGCDFDFLQAPTQEHRKVVPPVVGRS